MKLEPEDAKHARKRCPKDLSKKPTALGDRAIRSSKYLRIKAYLGVSGGEIDLPSRIHEFLTVGRWKSPLGRVWRRGGERVAAAAVKKKGVEGLTGHPAIYIPDFYYPKYPAPGPEYLDSPETPGHRTETPAPPDTKQIKHKRNLI